MNELKKMIAGSDFYKQIKANSKKVTLIVSSIEEGLKAAAQEFSCEIHDLQYNIVEEGSEGVFGIGQKPFKIEYWKSASSKTALASGGALDDDFDFDIETDENGVPQPQDVDGFAELHILREGIMLSVNPPKGSGKKLADFESVQQIMLNKEIFEYDVEAAREAFNKSDGVPVKIGDWTPNIYHDGKVTGEVAADEMRVFVTITPPTKNGREMEEVDVHEWLDNNDVTYGIDPEMIRNIFQNKVFGRPVLVAKGLDPQHGTNAKIDFKVNTDKSSLPKNVDENTSIDFRDLSTIENVQSGQVLAEKIPATNGFPGKSVRGGYLEAKDGADVDLAGILGDNTEISDDGLKVVSKINGQVVYRQGKLYVEEIYEVRGDVGPETGNITFLGTVLVTGNVLDNYRIDAAGNIDIKGSVGKCILEAKGDVIVKLGITGHMDTKDRDGQANVNVTSEGIYVRVVPARGKGKPLTETHSVEKLLESREVADYDMDLIEKIVRESSGKFVKVAHAPGAEPGGEGVLEIGSLAHSDSNEIEETHVNAGNDVIAKFIQYANVNAGRDVVVTEACMNSYVDAGRRVILVGKRAAIVGGRTRALTEVNGKTFGTDAGTKTFIEVGMSPATRQKLEELEREQAIIEDTLPTLRAHIQEAEKIANLDEDRQKTLDKNKQREERLRNRLAEITKQVEEISAALLVQNIDAKISAAKAIHGGVVPKVKTATLPGDEVRDKFKAVTLVANGDDIEIEAYQGTPQQVKQAAT